MSCFENVYSSQLEPPLLSLRPEYGISNRNNGARADTRAHTSSEEEEEEADEGEQGIGARGGKREASGARVLKGSVLAGSQGYVWGRYGAASDMGSRDATYTMAASFALNGRYV